MKKTHFCQKALVVALGSLYISIAQAQSYLPHVTLEGVTGSQTYGRLDALAPIVPGCNSLFYTDLQAKYGYDDAYYVGLGLGDRVISGDKILGGYLFLDYNESQHHHDYWILSPGVELLKACWDVRLNGYIPINGRQRNEGSFFPSGPNECGIHGDCSFVEFAGHQEFEHRFMRIEEAGPGADLVFGKKWGCNNLFQIGPYYYHMSDSNDIIGGVARVELPLRAGVSLVGEASYDNDHHGAAVMGLQYRFNNPQSCAPLCDRLYDQVYRYRGNLNTGTGIRVKHDNKDEGLFLRRDNIFFFSESGTAVLGDPNAGTFENPFAPTQFTQATVIDIGRDANFYFSTGTYAINPPAGILQLDKGQSLYGRSEDFKCTVNGDERPILLGGIFIANSTNHIFDSIQLRNIQTNPTAPVIALISTIAFNVDICNSDIFAEADFIGDAPALNSNIAEGIGGETAITNFVINNSRITAIASVTGNNSGFNGASAIGRTAGGLSSTNFIITNSELNAVAQVGLSNIGLAGSVASNMAVDIGFNTGLTGIFANNEFILNHVKMESLAQVGIDNVSSSGAFNLASGIGVNAVNSSGTGGPSEFANNNFRLEDSSILSRSLVGRDNISSDANSVAANMATGIGNNIAAAITTGTIIDLPFRGNVFEICNSEIEASAEVVRDNINPATVIAGGVLNAASGIGNNTAVINISASATGTFRDNDFFVSCSQILATALVGNNNFSASLGNGLASNMAAGIGNNVVSSLGSQVTADFSNNQFTLEDSQVIGTALVNNDNSAAASSNLVTNLAAGLGINATSGPASITSALFSLVNRFTITNTQLLGLSQIGNDNFASGDFASAFNEAIGMGGNVAAFAAATNVIAGTTTNEINIHSSIIDGVALISNNNLIPSGTNAGVFNLATGFGDNNALLGTPGSVVATFFNDNEVTICDTAISASAHIGGDNSATGTLISAFNQALGFGNNVAFVGEPGQQAFDRTIVDINCSSITATALVEGNQNLNGFNSATGVAAVSTTAGSTISIFDSFVDVLAKVNGSNEGTNLALGLTANGLDMVIKIFDSFVNVVALANGTNNAIATQGQVIAENTVFNVVEN